ncbi:MAG: hypothetical protein J0L72_06645 [Armatimonadetes bacterium]|nr:hypothetical protein [Armatimonadota bacterium]
MRFFFSAGESSGDVYASELVRRLSSEFPTALFEGIGGKFSDESGIKLVANSSRWGAIGIIESLKRVPTIYSGMLAAKHALRFGSPGIFVPIDFGYLNVRLCRLAKQYGWKVVYFIPPGSWNRHKQGRDLPTITDAIITPFSWSRDILAEMGAKVHYFGHPILELVDQSHQEVIRSESTVALLPGSRLHEINYTLPAMAAACEKLSQIDRILIPVASTVSDEEIRKLWQRHYHGTAELVLSRDRYWVLRTAAAAIVCSGTATLEAALCGCPFAIVYKGSKMMEFEAKIVRPKFDHIGMPNLILQERAFPELIQHEASSEAMANWLTLLLDPGSEERQAQTQKMAELRELVKPDAALTSSANFIAEFANQ